MDIKVSTRPVNDKTSIIEVQGEIDVYTASWVKDAVNEAMEKGHYFIIINLEKVRYIDSTGLGVLIGALKRAKEHKGGISLICTNPQIKKIFSITGLAKIFSIYKTEEESIKALAKELP